MSNTREFVETWDTRSKSCTQSGHSKIGSKGYHAFIMRAQPLHLGHWKLIHEYLYRGEKVLVLLMNTPVDVNNPFTIDDRVRMFDLAFRMYRDKGLMLIMEIPPIVDVNIGRSCGYRVLDSRGLEEISATKIRKSIRKGMGGWRDMVPGEVRDFIDEKLRRGENV